MKQLELFKKTNFFKPKICAYRNCDVLITLDYRKKTNYRYRKKPTPKILAMYNKQNCCTFECFNAEKVKLNEEQNIKKFNKANKICPSCKSPIPAVYRGGILHNTLTKRKNYCDEICQWFDQIVDRSFGYDNFERINLINTFRKNNEDFVLFKYVHKIVQSSYRSSLKKNRDFNIDTKYCFNLFPKDFICPVHGTKMHLHSVVEIGHQDQDRPSLDRTDSKLGYIKGNVNWMSWGANWLKKDLDKDTANKFLQYFKKIESKTELF